VLTALSEGTTARGGNVRRRGEQVVVASDVSMCERLARAWSRGPLCLARGTCSYRMRTPPQSRWCGDTHMYPTHLCWHWQ